MDENYREPDSALEEEVHLKNEEGLCAAALSYQAAFCNHINPSWNMSGVQTAAASLLNTFDRVSDIVQPALVCSHLAETMSGYSMMRDICGVVNIISPCAESSLSGVFTAAAESVQNATVLNHVVDEVLYTAAESVTPAVEPLLPNHHPEKLISAVAAAMGNIEPVQIEPLKTAWSVCDLFAGFSIKFQTLLEEFHRRLHDITNFIFQVLLSLWKEDHPEGLALLGYNSVKHTAALIDLGLPPPKQIREFAVRLRQAYLRKRQRVSGTPDDVEDDFVFIQATA